MFHRKDIYILLLLAIAVLINFSSAFAGVIFQDNFDNSLDWQSQQHTIESRSWGNTRADICTEYCPPKGWTSYRAAPSFWKDDRRKDTFIVDNAGARGGSGKGLTYNVEVSGHFGTWAGGSLDLWLGEAGYNELSVRYYMKFDSGWKWSDPLNQYNCYMKLLRISTFNDNIWTTAANPESYGGANDKNFPVLLPDWAFLKDLRPVNTMLLSSIRKAPDYEIPASYEVRSVHAPAVNEWHCYEFYVKMNSGNDVADGVFRVYLDDVLVQEVTNVVWKKSGSGPAKWNWIMLADNVTNASAPVEDHSEITYYIDDVVVSTEHIGLAPKQIMLNPPSF